MNKAVLSSVILFLLAGCGNNDPVKLRPDWENIKKHAMPTVALPNEYGAPYRQPHSTLAWEDGIFISRDGLHMYAFYAPADLWQYAQYAKAHPVCPDITPFLRGPQLGMDLTTNPWGCKNIMHSDIAYTSRASRTKSFAPWRLSSISAPFRYDGGFQALDVAVSMIDIVFSRATEQNRNDIFWVRGTQHNPSSVTPQALPSPINTDGQEDNPHLERLDVNTLVLLFDNHGGEDSKTTIKYSISVDDGVTWTQPEVLGQNINAGPHDMHGHLYFDGTDWWLYFASTRDGKLSIYRSRHRDSQRIQTAFDDWEQPELVIGPGVVTDNSGRMEGVGEPTLTADGDISFSVVYSARGDFPYDRVDSDPWYLARKR